jgi:SAM-dependent methyltransferase
MYNEIFSKVDTPELNNFVVERQKNRCHSSNLPKIMEVLSLPPVPVILDVGAGTGYFSYAFAEYLKDKGKIYAVEVFQDRYEYIKEQVKIRDYKSVFPVLLSQKNDDDFYWQNNYDLIFFGNSFEYVNNKQEFLFGLRKRLNENGKLAIIIHRDIFSFFSSDVVDQEGLIAQFLFFFFIFFFFFFFFFFYFSFFSIIYSPPFSFFLFLFALKSAI